MDEAVVYALETGGDVTALHNHIQHIRHNKSYPLRIQQYTLHTWNPDCDDQVFLAGIQAGFDMCEQIYNVPDWQDKSFPTNSGAPSKIVFYLRMALLEVDGRLYGLMDCLEEKENPEAILIEIKNSKRWSSPQNKDAAARIQAYKDGYALLTGASLMDIELTFGELYFDGEGLPRNSRNLHRFVADFSIIIKGNQLYYESEFCLVELAAYLLNWLAKAENQDFIYQSVEFEDVGLVWIKRQNDGWTIGAINQVYEETTRFTLGQITYSLNDFLARLNTALVEKYYVNLEELTSELVSRIR